MPSSVKSAGSGAGRLSSSPRAAVLALSTSGWSNGLIPMTRPATAVAYSHSRIWAPREPATAAWKPLVAVAAVVLPLPSATSTESAVLGW